MAASTLEDLNALPPTWAERQLLDVCASRRWARAVVAQRPFDGPPELLRAAGRAWAQMGPEDWREALDAHPRIGEPDAGGERERAEQAGAATADEEVRERMRVLNAAYEARFGHTFVVRAAGRDADELLRALEDRMANAPADELAVAAREQGEITQLRLERLLAS